MPPNDGQNGTSGANGGLSTAMMNPYVNGPISAPNRGPLADYASALAGPGPEMRLNQEDLAAWVRTRISPLQGKYRCTHFVLQHDLETPEGRDRSTITQQSLPEPAEIPAPTKGKKAAEIPTLSEDEEDEWVASLCEEFDRASYMHAATYPRMQRFYVGAVIVPPDMDPDEERKVHAVAEYPFLVTPPASISAGFQQSGDPNADINIPRLFQQAQESADKAVKLLVANMQENANRAERREQMLIEHNERMMERAFEQARLREELLDASALRAVQVRREEMSIKMHEELWLKLVDFGIVTGTKAVKAWMRPKADQIDSKIMQSMMTLDAKNLVEIIGVVNRMPAEQKAKFGPVIEMVVESFDDAKQMEVFTLLTATPAADEFKAGQVAQTPQPEVRVKVGGAPEPPKKGGAK